MLRVVLACAVLALLEACGGDEQENSAATASTTGGPPPDACPPGEMEGPSGCCPAGSLLDEQGHCTPAGIPPERCADGFAPDDRRGCDAILPPRPCGAGQMAVPGETACRAVAPCGDGTWGAIPVEATTQFVDASYPGADSDGTSAKPWTTLGAGVTAAAPGAIVALAAGSYAEDMDLASHPVRIWGRCPELVEIAGVGTYAAIVLRDGMDGTSIQGVSFRGPARAVASSGSKDVVLDHVWIHDTDLYAIDVFDQLGPTGLIVRDSLLESPTGVGVFAYGASVRLESSVVRNTRPLPDGTLGRCLQIQRDGDTGVPAAIEARGALLEACRSSAVVLLGSTGAFEASVVRDTLPEESSDDGGAGISVQNDGSEPSTATISGCVLERNRAVGLFVVGSEVTVDATVVRSTLGQHPERVTNDGVELRVDATSTLRAKGKISASVVERNTETGISVLGSSLQLESTVVRETLPNAKSLFGRGITVEMFDGVPADGTIRGCEVADNREFGIFLGACDGLVESTLVRDTKPLEYDQKFGTGLNIQLDPMNHVGANVTVRASVLERNLEFGAAVIGSIATLEGVVLRGTLARASDGAFGDGLVVASEFGDASATLVGSRVEGSARAGVSSFGASVGIGTSVFECNRVHLDGEEFEGKAFSLADHGGSTCGCTGKAESCQVASADLQPPTPP